MSELNHRFVGLVVEGIADERASCNAMEFELALGMATAAHLIAEYPAGELQEAYERFCKNLAPIIEEMDSKRHRDDVTEMKVVNLS